MGEMEYEQPPEVYVPRVRNWLTPALQDWHKFMYGRRRMYFMSCAFIVFFWWLIMIYVATKLMIYAGVGLVLMLAYGVWAIAECITYRRRLRDAALRSWAPYMKELLD